MDEVNPETLGQMVAVAVQERGYPPILISWDVGVLHERLLRLAEGEFYPSMRNLEVIERLTGDSTLSERWEASLAARSVAVDWERLADQLAERRAVLGPLARHLCTWTTFISERVQHALQA